MIGQIYHVGLTVSDLDRSVAFYRDVLGLQYRGELLMEGKETEAMFRREKLQGTGCLSERLGSAAYAAGGADPVCGG